MLTKPPKASTTQAETAQTKAGRTATLRKHARTPLLLAGAGLAVAGVVAATTGTAAAAHHHHHAPSRARDCRSVHAGTLAGRRNWPEHN